MGFFDKILGAIAGEAPEVKAAREKMAADAATDGRRAFVFGILAVSYEVDPGYLTAHATEAIRKWYEVRDENHLQTYHFGTSDGAAYDAYRHSFLARAGFAAGILSEPRSWELAFRQADVVARRYRSWSEYGEGYLAGHLAYRKAQGDAPARLAEIDAKTRARLAELATSGPWSKIPFSFSAR